MKHSYLIDSNHEERPEASNEGQQPVPMDLSIDSCDNRDDTLCSNPTDQPTTGMSDATLERDAQKMSSDLWISEEHVGGILKIVPPDNDVSI